MAGFAFIDAATEEQIDRLAAALDRPAEDILALGLVLLDWYVRQREQERELLVGVRDDPDDPDAMRVLRAPFELVQMDEHGVARHGRLDLASPDPNPAPASEQVPTPPAAAVAPAVTLDEWDSLVFLEASRICFQSENSTGATIAPCELVFRLRMDRSPTYGDEVWDEELGAALEQMTEMTLDRLAAADCFHVFDGPSTGKEYVFTEEGWALSDALYGNRRPPAEADDGA